MRIVPFAVLVAAGLCAAAAAQSPTTTTAKPHPGAARGWTAHTVHQGDAGIWYAHVAKVVPWFAQHEIVATDDKGRFLVLSVYSGNWSAHSCVPDGLWLAPTRPADVDPRLPGRELYAAGRGGSLHQITMRDQPFAKFTLESREIGHVRHEEFHAIVAADLDASRPGDELLAFAISGSVYQVMPSGVSSETTGETFVLAKLGEVPGRVRDVAVQPALPGKSPQLLGVSRSGDLLAMELTDGRLTSRSLLREDSGLGRIALSPTHAGVAYVTRDDGLLLRIELAADGSLVRQPMLATDQGLRGVAAGRFFADGREAVACYGYGRRVQMVTRNQDGTFAVEDLLTTVQQGHWLAVGELDGRNSTDELVATGFDGAVVLLAREPGYGLPGVAVPKADSDAKDAAGARDAARKVPRIAARFGPRGIEELSPLRYQGGFETKALVYETLLTQGPDGRLAPGLCSSWRIEDEGRRYVLTLREGAQFGDGTAVTAEAVVEHFRRWVGLPEHDWLGSNRRITAVQALSARELQIQLDRPWALLPDLCAINPTAVRAPTALSREGDFVQPVGSGPFTFAEARDDGSVLRYAARQGGGAVDLVRVDGDALQALVAGEVDAVVGSWMVPVDPVGVAKLRGDRRFQVVDAPGSSVWLLSLRSDAGPLQDATLRRAVAAAIDRHELVAKAVAGYGEPAFGFAAPVYTAWPVGKVPAKPSGVAVPGVLKLSAGDASEALVAALREQLARAGIATALVSAGTADWDLRCERTHGGPYDPFLTAVQRFGERAGRTVDVELARRVAAMQQDPDEARRGGHYAAIQARLDELVQVVPLFSPRRLAVVRAGLPVPKLVPQLYALDAEWLAAMPKR